jgi:hypothetical protein
VGDITLTLLTPDGPTTRPAVRHDDHLFLTADDLEALTGWTAKREGLCRDDACIPVRDPATYDAAGRLDLLAVAALLRRPLALELETDGGTATAVLGEATADRVASLESLAAPPFELPRLDGSPVGLATFASHKRLLLAWASW